VRAPFIAIGLVSAWTVAGAQAPGDVDFRRDVQPIFSEHCYGCHGPELQMNGFRLDRRADAMRGGQQTNIGPGNANGSRLYQRVAGSHLGPRMPPAGPLTSPQIATIKQWIDGGAKWPDDVSGEPPIPPADPEATRFLDAIRSGDAGRISGLITNRAAATNAGPRGMTALMAAALYGDASLVKRVLDAGGNPNARTVSGVTALMMAVPALDATRLLLEAGADVNAHSDDGRTALLITAGTSGARATLKLLLEYGADPFPWQPSQVSALREAARVDDAEMFAQLVAYGLGPKSPGAPVATFLRVNCAACASQLGAGGPMAKQPPESSASNTLPPDDPGRLTRLTTVATKNASREAIRAAVDRSLPRLQQIDVAFVQRTGCVSCHHNSLVSMAVKTAQTRGFHVDETITASQNRVIGTYLESWRERALQNIPIAGAQDTMSYLLVGLGWSGYQPDTATDAQAIWLKRRQGVDGRWSLATLRPPIESNDIEVTAMSMRALQLFAPPSRRAEYQQAVDRAGAWLTTARANATEERAFRLLGLSWASAPPGAIDEAVRQLLAAQRPDGGWAQEAAMPSDAYATGEALVAMRESGAVPADAPAFRKGIEYLLRTQYEDGTWYVASHSVPIQSYFESGFPYGAHQWISAAATAWATTALALGY
jgi:mono/diheme cytochrome c family protein